MSQFLNKFKKRASVFLAFSIVINSFFSGITFSNEGQKETIQPSSMPGSEREGTVDLATGDVLFTEKITGISGSNELNYYINFEYNSQIQKEVITWNREWPTGVIGLGWKINSNKVVRNTNGTGETKDDTFYLERAGIVSELAPGENPNEYFIKGKLDHSKINYDPKSETWTIIESDGKIYKYGQKTNSDSNYPASKGSSIKWGVIWDQFIGASKNIENQEHIALAWNLSGISDQWGEKLSFSYLPTKEKVGTIKGKFYTKALYLNGIKSDLGSSLKFEYSNKEKFEYQDPHTEQNEPDSYQEIFETKFLSQIISFNYDSNPTHQINLGYEILNPGNSKMSKRTLSSIEYFSKNQSEWVLQKPAKKFTYFNENDGVWVKRSNHQIHNHQALYGALKSITYPYGGQTHYHYGAQEIEAAQRTIDIDSPGEGWNHPRTYFGNNYAVVTWDKDKQLQVQIYEWQGEWIQANIGNNESLALESEDKKDILVVTQDQYAAIITNNPQSKNSTLTIIQRNSLEKNKWKNTQFNNLDLGVNQWKEEGIIIKNWDLEKQNYELIGGQNFIAAIGKPTGKLYPFSFNGQTWQQNQIIQNKYGTNNSDLTAVQMGFDTLLVIESKVYDYDVTSGSDWKEFFTTNEGGAAVKSAVLFNKTLSLVSTLILDPYKIKSPTATKATLYRINEETGIWYPLGTKEESTLNSFCELNDTKNNEDPMKIIAKNINTQINKVVVDKLKIPSEIVSPVESAIEELAIDITKAFFGCTNLNPSEIITAIEKYLENGIKDWAKNVGDVFADAYQAGEIAIAGVEQEIKDLEEAIANIGKDIKNITQDEKNLLNSIISLEGDNKKLQEQIEQLQLDIAKLEDDIANGICKATKTVEQTVCSIVQKCDSVCNKVCPVKFICHHLCHDVCTPTQICNVVNKVVPDCHIEIAEKAAKLEQKLAFQNQLNENNQKIAADQQKRKDDQKEDQQDTNEEKSDEEKLALNKQKLLELQNKQQDLINQLKQGALAPQTETLVKGIGDYADFGKTCALNVTDCIKNNNPATYVYNQTIKKFSGTFDAIKTFFKQDNLENILDDVYDILVDAVEESTKNTVKALPDDAVDDTKNLLKEIPNIIFQTEKIQPIEARGGGSFAVIRFPTKYKTILAESCIDTDMVLPDIYPHFFRQYEWDGNRLTSKDVPILVEPIIHAISNDFGLKIEAITAEAKVISGKDITLPYMEQCNNGWTPWNTSNNSLVIGHEYDPFGLSMIFYTRRTYNGEKWIENYATQGISTKTIKNLVSKTIKTAGKDILSANFNLIKNDMLAVAKETIGQAFDLIVGHVGSYHQQELSTTSSNGQASLFQYNPNKEQWLKSLDQKQKQITYSDGSMQIGGRLFEIALKIAAAVFAIYDPLMFVGQVVGAEILEAYGLPPELAMIDQPEMFLQNLAQNRLIELILKNSISANDPIMLGSKNLLAGNKIYARQPNGSWQLVSDLSEKVPEIQLETGSTTETISEYIPLQDGLATQVVDQFGLITMETKSTIKKQKPQAEPSFIQLIENGSAWGEPIFLGQDRSVKTNLNDLSTLSNGSNFVSYSAPNIVNTGLEVKMEDFFVIVLGDNKLTELAMDLVGVDDAKSLINFISKTFKIEPKQATQINLILAQALRSQCHDLYEGHLPPDPTQDGAVAFFSRNYICPNLDSVILNELKNPVGIEKTDSIRLHKVMNQNFTGALTDYFVSQTVRSDGYESNYTNYEYEADGASFDSGGNTAIYQKTTIIPIGSNPSEQRKPYGYSEHYFLNKEAETGNLFVNSQTVEICQKNTTQCTGATIENFPSLEGKLYRTAIYNANNQLVESNENQFKIGTYQSPNKHKRHAIFTSQETNTLEGVISKIQYEYDPIGRRSLDRTFNFDPKGSQEITETTYIYASDKYPALETKNFLNEITALRQVLCTTEADSCDQTANNMHTERRVDTWKDWGNNKWAKESHYKALNNKSGNFNYQSKNSTKDWLQENQILFRDPSTGVEISSINANKVPHSLVLAKNQGLIVAGFINANSHQSEAGYFGAESYENTKNWNLGEIKNSGYTGSKSVQESISPKKFTPIKNQAYVVSARMKPNGTPCSISFGKNKISTNNKNNWQYLEKTITSASANEIPIATCENGLIDDFRFAPVNAVFEATVYDTNFYEPIAHINNNGETGFIKYNDQQEIIQVKESNGLILEFDYQFSRSNNSDFNPEIPNQIITTMNNGRDSRTHIRYSDGWDRETQTQDQKNNNTFRISEIMYDGWGNPAVETKYAHYQGQSPEYQKDFITSFDWESGIMEGEIANYYQSGEGSVSNIGDDYKYAYSQVIYENNPLNRPIETTKPGFLFKKDGNPNYTNELNYGIKKNSDFEKLFKSIHLNFSSDTLQKFYGDTESKPFNNLRRINTNRIESINQLTLAENLGDPTVNITTSTDYQYDYASATAKMVHFQPMSHASETRTKNYSTQNQLNYLKQLTSKTEPDSGTTQYAYDSTGRLRFSVDEKGLNQNPNQVKYFKYDSLNRIIESGFIEKNWQEISFANIENINFPVNNNTWRNRYLYDLDQNGNSQNLKGRLYQIQSNNQSNGKADAWETYQYTPEGLIQSITQKVNDFSQKNYTYYYTYNPFNEISNIEYPKMEEENSLIVSYTYNKLGQNTNIGTLEDAGHYAQFEYDAEGNIKSQSTNNGNQPIKKVNTFNFINQSKGFKETINDQLSYSETLRYTLGNYYQDGNIQTSEYALGKDLQNLKAKNHSYQYNYDPLGRLILATSNDSKRNIEIDEYDLNGNILKFKKLGTENTYEYESKNNQLKAIKELKLNFNYNENGDIKSAGFIKEIKYDPFRNRLTELKKAGNQSNYQYIQNKRVLKKEAIASNSPFQKLYLWGQNDMPLSEIETDSTHYIYGPQGLIAYIEDNQENYVSKDYLNSTRVIRDQNNQVKAYYSYLPFGQSYEKLGSEAENFNYRYTGQEWEPSGALYNYKARMYNPAIGRFYQTDEAKDYYTPYAYANNNPINLIDSDGRASHKPKALAKKTTPAGVKKVKAKKINQINATIKEAFRKGHFDPTKTTGAQERLRIVRAQVKKILAGSTLAPTGSETNQAARDYVNGRRTDGAASAEITKYRASFTYTDPATGKKFTIESGIFKNTPGGQDWDAGHVLARQNGGVGVYRSAGRRLSPEEDGRNLFGQNFKQNRGRKGHQDWRRFERRMHREIKKSGGGEFEWVGALK